MERMLLATGALSDQATITGPTGAGDLVLGNLKRQSLQEVYRVLGDAAELNIDLGAAQLVNVVAIMGHSGLSGSTARVTASNTPGGADYDSGAVPFITGTKHFDKSLFFLFFQPVSYRYWRIEISNPGAAYLDLGRLYIAKAFQPSFNMVYGFQHGFTDGSQEFETSSGDSISLKRKKRRFADLMLEDLSEDEVFAELYPLDQLVGATGDVLLVPKPDDTHLQFSAIYGKIEAMQPNVNTSFNRFTRQFRVRELLP
ncbi:hypothetical protein [Hymenobacter fodinae]|uniref:F5/8 type C domain-containing protein n=1 Tax=Hymenobacter fodinae TaxID=2510796 RepID=A0A4Z0P0S1_9BACT|nr:hypothetical protein [Hymenobacter fodinae]TGE04623.1 hypothetical protein EU556_20780 [Hymenobacter fodinae]